MSERHIIIGTAGHIDHGKSTLVKALTGMDPDRLAEEKERGLTIDLGFAFYGDRAAFIDVPGHERFIKNMVAGVTTIDMAILLVAADDGVMPQTREHLDILNVLGVPKGFVVISKVDLVETEWVELVRDDVKSLTTGTFLDGAPILSFSAVTGEGLDAIRKTLDDFLDQPTQREDRGFFWMPVDRSFSIKGFGTVVTGSVLSGSLTPGSVVELLPAHRLLKVRGLQKHEKPIERIALGDRAAINLAGIAKNEIERGNVLATPNFGKETKRIDAKIQLLKHADNLLRNQERVRFHVGTSEVFARIRLLTADVLQPGESGLAQFFFEEEVVLNRLDRFVIRRYSPQITVGGGVVLDTHPFHRHKRFNEAVTHHLHILESRDPETVLLEFLKVHRFPRTTEELAFAVGIPPETTKSVLQKLEERGLAHLLRVGQKTYAISKEAVEEYKSTIPELIAEFHRRSPVLPGIPKAELHHKLNPNLEESVFQIILTHLEEKGLICIESDRVRLPHFEIKLDQKSHALYSKLLEILEERKFQPPKMDELEELLSVSKQSLENLIQYGRQKGDLLVLEASIPFLKKIVNQALEKTIDFVEKNKGIHVGDFRNLLQTTRKYAVPLLEYFDGLQVTEREEDMRVPGVKFGEYREKLKGAKTK